MVFSNCILRVKYTREPKRCQYVYAEKGGFIAPMRNEYMPKIREKRLKKTKRKRLGIYLGNGMVEVYHPVMIMCGEVK